jgi:RNA polymerase-binding transcription factor DksA
MPTDSSVEKGNLEESMPPIDIAKTAAALTEERETLLHQLSELGADENGELTGKMDYGDAFADAGAATAERTETMGIIENLKNHLDDVEAAIARIEDGTLGICTDCGKTISDDRMEYRPTSSKCIDCKTKSA